MNLDAERLTDELTGDDAIAALDDALQLFTQPAKVHVVLKDIEVKKVGGRILLTVKYRGKATNEFTVRLSSAWAKVLTGRLRRVIER
jgi:hypothetical protein